MMHTVGRRPREGTAGDVQDVRRHRASETRRRRGPAGYEAGGRWRLVFLRAATAFLIVAVAPWNALRPRGSTRSRGCRSGVCGRHSGHWCSRNRTPTGTRPKGSTRRRARNSP